MTLKQMLGLDTRAERYSYGNDPVAGYVSAQKVPDKWVATTCGYCSVGCGMFIGVKDGKAVSVRGNPDHKVNRGLLCPKGLSEHHTIRTDNRALYPHAARRQALQPDRLGPGASRRWRQKFRDVQARFGPGAVGVISTGQLVTEEFYTLGKLVQLGLGTTNYDGNTTLCMATAVQGYKRSFGSDGPPGTYEDLEKADVVILIGANIAENHPILCWRLRSNPSTTLIVVDPRVTKTAMMADLHLPLKPRSDLALVNGLIHVVIEHNFVNREYIERAHHRLRRAARGGQELHARARRRDHRPLARDDRPDGLALRPRARPAFIGWTMGVNHSTKGTETVNAINNLALITGNIGREGAAPFSITGQCNAMGTREAGFASIMPGYRKFESADDREDAGGAVERAGRADSDQARAGLSRHHRGGARQEDPRALDHRHQPDRLVPESRLADAGARGARVPGGAGRLSPDADLRVRAPDAAGGDLGREGRHLHQLRAAREQGQSRGAAARRGALRLRHLPGAGRRARRAATSCSRAGRSPATRSRSGRRCRRAGSATTRA